MTVVTVVTDIGKLNACIACHKHNVYLGLGQVLLAVYTGRLHVTSPGNACDR